MSKATYTARLYRRLQSTGVLYETVNWPVDERDLHAQNRWGRMVEFKYPHVKFEITKDKVVKHATR